MRSSLKLCPCGSLKHASCPLPTKSKAREAGEEGQREVTCWGMRVGVGWHLRHLRWRQLAHGLCLGTMPASRSNSLVSGLEE